MTQRIHGGWHKAPGGTYNYPKVPTVGTWNIEHGKDHACGYFIQWEPVDKEAKEFCKSITHDECIDLDQMFDGLTPHDYLSILYSFGINEYM